MSDADLPPAPDRQRADGQSLLLGLDFGGTKLAAGLVDTTGYVLARARCPTPDAGAEAGFAAMVSLAWELVAVRPPDAQLTGVGVSFGGPVHGDGRTVRRSFHVPGWAELPLAARLEQLFGVPAAIANDADAAALAEYRFGAGQGVRHLLYVTVSTGIGAGLVLDGRLHRGEHAWAGEIGHLPLKPDGPPCPCGRNGCLEAFASGRSIARAAQQRLRHADDERTLDRASGLWALPREHITAQDVATAAAVGDGLAASVWAEAMGWLGLGIAAAANLLNPGRVVIGGGLARAGPLLFDPVRQTAARYLLDPHSTIVSAALGDDVGIIGGAALVL